MKTLVLFVVITVLLVAPLNLHANSFNVGGDTINLTLTSGANVLALSSVGVGSWTYSNTQLCVLVCNGETIGVLSTITNTINVTYADVTGTLGVLTVTDVCASTALLAVPIPCQQFALSYSNVSLPNLSLDLGLGVALGANVNLALGGPGNGINIPILGLSVGSATATINATPTPTPEPATLSLLATGLAGAAGLIRRRFSGANDKAVLQNAA